LNQVSPKYKLETLPLENYWVFGLCPSFGILKTREHDFPNGFTVSRAAGCYSMVSENTMFQKLDLFLSSDEGETPEDGNTSNFQNIVFSSF
jgi:hypothetical protein